MNTYIFKTAAITIMLLMTTIGCNKTTAIISKIDSKIAVTMMESSSQTFQMYFSTTKKYPCYNYLIDLSLKKSLLIIDITYKGVIETDMCLTAFGPATTKVDLGVLHNGTYQLNFYNEHIRQSGELIVSSNGYTTNFVDNSICYFTNTSLHKIPENTLWMAINYDEEEKLLSFLEDLKSLEVTEKTYASGYYSFESALYPGSYSGFKIEENGTIIYYPDLTDYGVKQGRPFTQSFVFQYSGNTEDIGQVIKQYKEQIEIRAYRDSGEQILSWL